MVFKPVRGVLLAAAVALPAIAGHASGLDSLENFMKTVKSGKADFTQVSTSPPRDGQAPRSKTTSGSFEFARPGRFKFAYKKPFEQTIVADGQTLWLYDVDLNQVTASKQAQALGSTPAALVSSAADIKSLQADYTLAAAPEKDGLEWVVATPKTKDGQLQSVRVGFKGKALAVLEILDSFGQRSVLSFANFQPNVALDAAAFSFKPPPGADVVRR